MEKKEMCMSKVDIKVIIKNNNEVSEEKYVALKNKQKIEYFEKEFKTSLFLKDVVKIKRENEDYLFDMEFIPDKETKGMCKLKKEDAIIDLKILTDYVIIEENVIIIKYKVLTTEQDVVFKLEM